MRAHDKTQCVERFERLVLKVAKSSKCSKRRSLGCGSSGVSTSCLRVKRQAYSASMRMWFPLIQPQPPRSESLPRQDQKQWKPGSDGGPAMEFAFLKHMSITKFKRPDIIFCWKYGRSHTHSKTRHLFGNVDVAFVMWCCLNLAVWCVPKQSNTKDFENWVEHIDIRCRVMTRWRLHLTIKLQGWYRLMMFDDSMKVEDEPWHPTSMVRSAKAASASFLAKNSSTIWRKKAGLNGIGLQIWKLQSIGCGLLPMRLMIPTHILQIQVNKL